MFRQNFVEVVNLEAQDVVEVVQVIQVFGDQIFQPVQTLVAVKEKKHIKKMNEFLKPGFL